MLIQIHMLQNYAPANLNRDQTGAPKDAIFGGKRRGRISSQCLKRSIRRSDTFAQTFEENGLLANRTKRLPKLVREQLQAMGVSPEDSQNISSRLAELGGGNSDDLDQSKLLVFLGANEVVQVAEKLRALYEEVGAKKYAGMKANDIEKTIIHDMPKSVDIAMFGRMTTSPAFEDVQAAVQVAHALSVNALEQEFDYFTAVDDLKPASEDPGAGMIGDIEFNSSTYYKYINIHWENLVANLGGDEAVATQAVTALLEAAATANPSGKQNSFAAHNLPDFVLVEVSLKNVPVSYANAFLQPARDGYSKDHKRQLSLMENAIAKLGSYATRLRKGYGLNGSRAYFTIQEEMGLDGVKNAGNLSNLKTWTAKQIQEATSNE